MGKKTSADGPKAAKTFYEERPARALAVFLLLATGYFYTSVQRNSAGVILPSMAADYGFSAALVGFLSSLFFYTYGLLQNVWGALNDRLGPPKGAAIGMAIAGVGSLIFLVSHAPAAIAASRVVCGLGLACIFTGVHLFAAVAFPASQYPFWVGCILVIGNLGTVAAIAPLGFLMKHAGYDGLYVVLALWAFALAILLLVVGGSFRTPHEEGAPTPKALLSDQTAGFKLLSANRARWIVAFAWCAGYASFQTLHGLWGVTWLQVSSGASRADAMAWTSIFGMGLLVGSPIGVRIVYRRKSARDSLLRIMTALLLSWLAYLAAAWLQAPVQAMGTIAFVVAVLTAVGMVGCNSTLKSMVPISKAGLVIGTGNMLVFVAVIAYQWLSGLIIGAFPAPDAPGGSANAGFLAAFGLIALAMLASVLWIRSVPSFEAKAGED